MDVLSHLYIAKDGELNNYHCEVSSSWKQKLEKGVK